LKQNFRGELPSDGTKTSSRATTSVEMNNMLDHVMNKKPTRKASRDEPVEKNKSAIFAALSFGRQQASQAASSMSMTTSPDHFGKQGTKGGLDLSEHHRGRSIFDAYNANNDDGFAVSSSKQANVKKYQQEPKEPSIALLGTNEEDPDPAWGNQSLFWQPPPGIEPPRYAGSSSQQLHQHVVAPSSASGAQQLHSPPFIAGDSGSIQFG
ncbi:unnamed protein product, partial [Amoebophrya sp. A120]